MGSIILTDKPEQEEVVLPVSELIKQTAFVQTSVKVDDNYPPPEDPKWFNNKLKEALGEYQGYQRYRVVWGQQAKKFRAGAMRLKYVYALFSEDRLHGVDVHNWKGRLGQTKRLSFKEADKYHPRKGEFIVPIVEHYEKEIGDPFFWLEWYAPPTFYAENEKQWNESRWLVTDEGKRIDLTGPYPSNGSYEPLMRLSSLVEKDGELFEEYRPINENTFNWIRDMLLGDKEKLQQALREQSQIFSQQLDDAFNDPDIDKEAEKMSRKPVSIIVP